MDESTNDPSDDVSPLQTELARLLRLIKSECQQPAVPVSPDSSNSSDNSHYLAESLLDKKPRYHLIFSNGLYAWYRLPACEVPLRLPLWPGKVEHYDQEKRVVLLRPAIAGYEHETEEVHLTQVVAWFQVNLDRGTVKEVLLHAPRFEPANQADRRSNDQAVKESNQ